MHMKADTVKGEAASSVCKTRCLLLWRDAPAQHCHRDRTVHAGAKAHTWMPVYERSSKLRLTMEVRSVGMTGSSPMHTLRIRESKFVAPARALLRVRLSSWVQKVASKADRLGQVSFSACSRLQPLQTNNSHLSMHVSTTISSAFYFNVLLSLRSKKHCSCCLIPLLSVICSNDVGPAKRTCWTMLPLMSCDVGSHTGNKEHADQHCSHY